MLSAAGLAMLNAASDRSAVICPCNVAGVTARTLSGLALLTSACVAISMMPRVVVEALAGVPPPGMLHVTMSVVGSVQVTPAPVKFSICVSSVSGPHLRPAIAGCE